MNLKFGFSIVGLVISIVPMLINILYAVWPPANTKKDRKQPVWDQIESISRVLYAVAICILVPAQPIDFKSIFFYGMVVFIVLYYIVWIRYFVGGRDTSLLGKSFMFVPMPLSIFPVLYFIFSALWVKNYIAFGFMIGFGIAHNVVSYRNLYIKSNTQSK